MDEEREVCGEEMKGCGLVIVQVQVVVFTGRHSLCGAALTWLLLHYRTSDLAWPGAELETDWSSRAINSGL